MRPGSSIYAVVDRIIDYLNLIFVASKPPPPHLAGQEDYDAQP